MLTFICYIGVDFTFGLLDCVRYNEDFVILRFVISRFCSIHFTVTLAGLKNIVRYTEDFVILRFVKIEVPLFKETEYYKNLQRRIPLRLAICGRMFMVSSQTAGTSQVLDLYQYRTSQVLDIYYCAQK